uniref:Uncharacterized protein n=1 Tax=Timema poppense TaxID=170557 RepID=A0A7R9HAV2_TIMPO|nr:unnamed protein product [Timema poppensis]
MLYQALRKPPVGERGPMSSYFSKPKNSLVLPEKLWLSLMDITKRYEDDCPVAVPKPSSLLLEPLIRDHPLVVRFTDRECQSSNIVGGKGSSLALLSTLRDQVSPANGHQGDSRVYCDALFTLRMELFSSMAYKLKTVAPLEPLGALSYETPDDYQEI